MLSGVLKIAYIVVCIFMYMYTKYMWFNPWNPMDPVDMNGKTEVLTVNGTKQLNQWSTGDFKAEVFHCSLIYFCYYKLPAIMKNL